MKTSNLGETGQRPDEFGTVSLPVGPPSLADQVTRAYHPAADPEATTGHVASPDGLPSHAGSCRLEREIGRGGMGVVVRALDPFFGRQLAVKILLARADERPDLARRFIAEARLTGRLQHPGIPPVHEQGTLADGRPYFTMKLIQGRTLGDLLKERAGPLDDLPRFVTVFGQVCQTVAYAHSQGVIHRDLKPGNVMVGAFGEVQVMDWGLAKDRRAHAETETGPADLVDGEDGVTQAGQAVGTPAYMPPEQARGEAEGLDERADVFGLGAILCSLLTGRAPYEGSSVIEVLRRAQQADLADAEKRLSTCGADAELIDIARLCLTPDPAARPHDAGAVAGTVARYQEGVQERLRKAEVDRAAAQARVHAERGKRRLTLALAGTVVAVVLGGGGVWVWLQQEYQTRLKQTVDQASQAVGKAITLRGQAAAISLLDVERWREAEALRKEALTAGEQAAQILAHGEADPETRQAVEDLLPRLRAEFDSTARDRAMLERLHAIRFVANDAVTDDDFDRYLESRANEDRFIYSQLAGASEYVKAFADYGIDVESFPVDQAAAAFADGRIKADLVASVDDWLRLTDPGPRRDTLLAITRLVDPDPVRDRLRLALSRGDVAALEELASSAEALGLPVSSVLLLAEGLFQKNKVASAVALLRQAQRRHAGDFWINNKLGEYLMYRGGDAPPQMEEAMRFFTAALVIRPRSVTARVNLADALAFIGAHEEAEAAYRQALEDQPTLAYVRNKLAATLAVDGRYADALEESRRAVELRPGSAFIHEGHGGVCFLVGRYEEAAAAYRKAIDIRPDVGSYHSGLGQALTEMGHTQEALKAHGEAVRLKPSSQTYTNLANTLIKCERVPEAVEAARTALRLQPGSPVGLSGLASALAAAGRNAEAVELYREALVLTPRDSALWWRLGKVFRSEGKNEEAVVNTREAIRRGPRQGPRLAVMYNELGLAYSDLKKLEEAVVALHKAAKLAPEDVIIRENLGDILRDLGRLDEALDVFREAVQLKPQWTDPRTRLADVLERLGRIDEAADVLSGPVANAPECFDRRVRLYQDHGRHREALELLEEWLKTKPDDGAARHRLGVSLDKMGRLAEAITAYERALTGPATLRLNYAPASLDFATALLEQSRRLEQEGRLEEARKMSARGHAYQAWGLNRGGKKAAAIAEAAASVRINPGEPKYQKILADYLRDTHPEEALTIYCAMLAAEPGSFEIHQKMAELFHDLERPDEALTAYQIMIDRDPTDQRSHRAAARLLMESGRLSQALVHFLKGNDEEGRKRCERLMELEHAWLSRRDESARPRDGDLTDLADLCRYKDQPAAASRYYAEAVRLKILKPGTKEAHAAVQVAALAGCGAHNAVGLSEPDRKALRDRALAGLRDELAETMKTLTTAGPSSANSVIATAVRWQREKALAGVRDPHRLGELPEVERRAWESLWGEVEALRQLAQSMAP